MDIIVKIFKGNYLLNVKKIQILEKFSKLYDNDPNILRKIVLEYPFLLDNYPLDEPSLVSSDYINKTIAEEIYKICHSDVHIYGYANYTLVPLDTATNDLKNEIMYDAVQLLINSGANVNIKNRQNKTPLHALCCKIEDKLVMRTLRYILENGKCAIAALRYENKFFILDIAISTTKCFSSKLEVATLLLEFGARPVKESLCKILRERRFHKVKFEVLRLVKLLMQFLLLNDFKRDIFNVNKHVSAGKYDKILDLNFLSGSRFLSEVIKYRNNLIKELSTMIHHKIDEYTSLFSYFSNHCSRGLFFNKNEPFLFKVLSIQQSKKYVCCDDLFYTSIKRAAVLPLFCNLIIFVRKPSREKIVLNSYMVSYLASYLNRTDMVNLILTYWMKTIEKEKIPAKRYLRKRKL